MRRAVLTFAFALALPGQAAAFDSFEAFGAPVMGDPAADPPVDPGGGGGRYFTGSLSDGYACSVCHFGGAEPEFPLEVEITPDPFADGYRSGTAYQISVTLPYTRAATGTPTGAFAANLELVNGEGRGAGAIAVSPVTCNDGSGEPATHVADLENPTRQVAGIDPCLVTVLNVTWTAPATNTGPVWLNIGAVSTLEASNDPSNDTAIVYARLIPPLGGVNTAGRVDSACAASPASPPRAPWLLALIALAAIRKLRTDTRP